MSSATSATEPRPVRRELAWRTVVVAAARAETASARSIQFEIDGWSGHLAGQHLDVRLTAPDGYQATRSYSLSSGPAEAAAITVERVDDGEVSPHLVDVVEVGDKIEVRGPIGGYFVWEPSEAPLLLIGGGSGLAPLRSMWRSALASDLSPSVTVLYSARSIDRVLFADELAELSSRDVEVRLHITRESHDRHAHGRIGLNAVRSALSPTDTEAVYVCGPTAFVETIARHLVDLDVDPTMIRTERFG